jgi:hypothetical protein
MLSAIYAPSGWRKFTSMGIDDSKPISTGVAPSWSKKLISNTPPVMLEKIVAKTPSIVDAFRLVLVACLEIFDGASVLMIGADAGRGSSTSKTGEDKVFTIVRLRY